MENNQLITLIKLYYDLPKAYTIDNPNFLNFICKIFDICDVYISNRALKHIVESRKGKDFMSVEEIINMIKNFTNILLDPDVVFINKENSIGICKNVKLDTSLSTLIILEYINHSNHYEIVTTYERKKKQIQKIINIKHLIK